MGWLHKTTENVAYLAYDNEKRSQNENEKHIYLDYPYQRIWRGAIIACKLKLGVYRSD